MERRRRKNLIVALKTVVGLGLLALVVGRLGPREVWSALRDPAWGPLAVALLTFALLAFARLLTLAGLALTGLALSLA